MGKKGSKKKKASNFSFGSQSSITLREESSGKRQSSINAKSMLKLDHIRNLAVWAGREASIPSLGAFFGQRLAALGEALGASPDPSLFPCQMCESILHPGHNCTVRIEKNTANPRRRRKRTNISTKNSVVYKCQFCSHRNIKTGTRRGHMKEICPPKAKPAIRSNSSPSLLRKCVNSEEASTSNPEVKRTDEIASPAMVTEDRVADNNPATPLLRTHTTLLEAKRRKRNRSGSKKIIDESQSNYDTLEAQKSASTSSKRKKKSWTNLKEIAENSDRANRFVEDHRGCEDGC